MVWRDPNICKTNSPHPEEPFAERRREGFQKRMHQKYPSCFFFSMEAAWS
jgi:hypothetical protein